MWDFLFNYNNFNNNIIYRNTEKKFSKKLKKIKKRLDF